MNDRTDADAAPEAGAASAVVIGRCIACGHPLVAAKCSECGATAANARWLGVGVDPDCARRVARRLGAAQVPAAIAIAATAGPSLLGLAIALAWRALGLRGDPGGAVAFYGTGLLLPLQLAWPVQLMLRGRALRAAEAMRGAAPGSWRGPTAQLIGLVGTLLLVVGVAAGEEFVAPVFVLTVASLPLMLDALLAQLAGPPFASAMPRVRGVRAARIASRVLWPVLGVVGLIGVPSILAFPQTAARVVGLCGLVGMAILVPIELLGTIALARVRRALRH